jgi:hypothetical protein
VNHIICSFYLKKRANHELCQGFSSLFFLKKSACQIGVASLMDEKDEYDRVTLEMKRIAAGVQTLQNAEFD